MLNFFEIVKKKVAKLANRILFKWRYQFYLRKRSLFETKDLLIKRSESQLDVVTIAFNNARMIEYQILLIKKYLKDSHTHIVADNSKDKKIRVEIRDICLKHNILYVSIPLIHLKPSWSHAAALHWVFCNVVLKRKSVYFGFIDHDIFPTEDAFIINKMSNGIYGRVIPPYGATEINNQQPYWSLWAGFFFFKSNFFNNISKYSFDFFPKVISENLIFDTCGGLWDLILSKLPIPEKLVEYEQVQIDATNYKNLQADAYEKLDNWIHIVNLSNWYGVKDMSNKSIYIEGLIKSLLKK